MKRALLRAAVAILAFRLVWMYIIPAWSEITTDFQNYYTAAWAVRHNHPLIDLYDTSWFQRESESAGMETQTALFNYFTPVSALVMWPVASFPALEAKRIWVVANLIALMTVVLVLAKFLNASRTFVLLIALLGGDALGNNFTFGQFYIVLTLLLVLAVVWLERRPALAGWCISVAASIKLFPALFIVQFAVLRRWKAAFWGVAGGVVVLLAAVAIAGWIPHRVYLEEVLPRTLRGEIQDPYNVRWNTLQALLRRAFVAEPGLNPHPIADAPWLFFFLRTFIGLSVLSITFLGLRRQRLGFVEYGALIAAVSLITPSQASYHQVLFFPAFAAAIHFERDLRVQMALAAVFALICSNYMGAAARWDSGLAMLLAFPRVYLVAGVWGLWVLNSPPKLGGVPFARFSANGGVVPQETTPSAPVKVASRHFLDGAATPPNLGGEFRGPATLVVIGGAAIFVFAMVSAAFEWQRWKADGIDGAIMARPEEHGLLEVHPTVGSTGLVFSALRPEGYTLIHPSAFGSGLVYESHGAVAGRLPDGSGIRWSGAAEPSLGPQSVVAVSADGESIVERAGGDTAWRELFRRGTVVHDPAISPDGRFVVFAEWVGGRYRLAEWNRMTATTQILLEGPADYRYPKYAPAAAEIAFATNETGNWDIGRYSLDSRQHEILSSSRGNDFMPAYSSDGTRMYFASDRRRGYRFTAIYSIALAR